MKSRHLATRPPMLAVVLSVAACSHYANLASTAPAPVTSAAATTPVSPPAATLAGLQPNAAFSISPAAQATAGANSTSPVLAAGSSSGPLPLGTALPLTESALLIASNAVAPDAATNSGGATVIYGDDSTPLDFTLHVPALGANFTSKAADKTDGFFTTTNILVDGYGSTFNYAFQGLWVVTGASTTTVSAFMAGVQTPASAVPSLGSALFVGAGFGAIFSPKIPGDAFNPTGARLLNAYVTMNANFGSGAITGSMQLLGANDVAFSAQIASGTNSFSGTTSVTSVATSANGIALNANATGTIDGQFYGPNAQEAGAVWTLSDGTATEIGSFGATFEHVEAAAPASYGATPVPAQIATTGGPTFDSTGGELPPSMSFPLLATALQISQYALSPVGGNQSATVTLDSVANTLHVVIPSAGVDRLIPMSGALTSQQGSAGAFGLSYVAIGDWGSSSVGAPSTRTMGAFGFETPASAMPTTGTAVYAGAGTVRGTVYEATSRGPEWAVDLKGDANLSVDFASGSIAGKFNNITANDYCFPPAPWGNEISVSANIAPGTNKFNGTTAVSAQSNPGGSGLKSTATGSINGAFYGPNAQQLGAIWSLSDGKTSVLGGIVASH